MVRQQRLTASTLALLLAMALAAGCASTYPPPPSGPPSGPGERMPPEPAEPEPPEPEEAEPAPPVQDTRAPTLALLRQSERSADEGDLEGAIAYVERAIRLNSHDPALWLRLARLQLEAERPAAAEQLAHKAIALSGRQAEARRQGWLLVADALEALGDDEAAARIRAQWRTFRG